MQNTYTLRVYTEAETLAVEVYRVVRLLPTDERFALGQQLRRAAVSVGSNIAEGTSRDSSREMSRFLSFALGSAAEIEFQLRLVVRLGMASDAQVRSAAEQCRKIQRMLIKFRIRLRPPELPAVNR